MRIFYKFILFFLVIAVVSFSCNKPEDDNIDSNLNIDITPYNCQGDAKNCDLRYDEYCFITTQRSYSYAKGANPSERPSQPHGIYNQLAGGAEALTFDIALRTNTLAAFEKDVYTYNAEGDVYYDRFSILLEEVRLFLEANPFEVVTIFINSGVSAELIDSCFIRSGLKSHVYRHNNQPVWPTFRNLIDDSTRLIVFSHQDVEAQYRWLHYTWRYMSSGAERFEQLSDFSCGEVKGNTGAALYYLPHYLSEPGYQSGNIALAGLVNAQEVSLERLLQCADESGKIPNYFVVEHYSSGNIEDAVSILNSTQFIEEDPQNPNRACLMEGIESQTRFDARDGVD